ncbi:MAG: methionyl-tRNA formyltransferase, partial [Mucilaginibacter polytrichastri]|nr:methionyl-tRNA formyltransferase [Mucilaginibacter polytrichastri]
QPEKLKNPGFIDELKSLYADVQVVVAFRMLPEIVWNMPPLGTVNVHASLLPQYRGAAPINWAVINGETETGVTIFKLQQEIDTGNILSLDKVPVSPHENVGEVHDKLMLAGANLLVATIRKMEAGTIEEIPQEKLETGTVLKSAPKLSKETARIDWQQPVKKVYDHIRGLSPYPAAYTTFQDKTLKIYLAAMEEQEPGIQPGAFLSDGKTFLKFACAGGFIKVKDVQLEGKKRMPVTDFLRGQHL